MPTTLRHFGALNFDERSTFFDLLIAQGLLDQLLYVTPIGEEYLAGWNDQKTPTPAPVETFDVPLDSLNRKPKSTQ